MERFAIKIDKKLKQNLYKICRLCGIDNPDMVPILTDKSEERKETENIDVDGELEMSQKISLLIGLTITKDDRMPQTMCCLCVDKINDFYEFREMCYATNAQTRKLLGLKNVKKPVVDIKPKVEVKEESIVPTPVATPSGNKNANRKRKSEELQLKEEAPYIPPSALPKKKLRFSAATDLAVKEEVPVIMKKKLRFSAMNEDFTTSAAGSSKKSKNNPLEESKLKKEPSPPPVVSNKKLRLAAVAAAAAVSTVPPHKELPSNKKTKQKGGKTGDFDVKEEIKEEIKEEPAAPAAPPAPKLKFGCNICKERFAAKTNLDVHTRTTHLPRVERYVCTACNEVLSKSFDIKNHQLWHKLSKTPYVCGCCGESILNTYAFSRHLREHGFETPPALLVLDRECPQCHTSYATNYLYNIHICAVRTKRCAGCNRWQRNEAEYLKHSALCAKVYLNYSKHIMPSVEALEDAVRIKNENDVEAAAEEMARISGLPLDMAPVVQLTRLSSPIIMAANQSVSMTGLDDSTSSSSKKSGKKGVSKKDLKRVDELLKSTLDALVSIKHEPEVHVEPETPCAGVHSDNDEDHEETGADAGGLDDFHHNDDDTDDEEAAATETSALNVSTGVEQIKIKQEIDETNEENANKIGGGLKLKIKKEHGQLNSSIIEQQKSSEKRAEKRKKKKKHKDKEKDKQKLSRDMQDEQLSQDSPAHNSEENTGTPMIRIKAEPQDDHEIAGNIPVASSVQIRPQPEATIMTSIPMMQFQIACVSSGVEFNNGATGAITETQTLAGSTINHETEPEDVKPNREELDRLMKISNVSSGIAMETDDATVEAQQQQPMDHDGNEEGEEQEEDDYHDGADDHHHDNEDNESEQQDDNQSEEQDENEADENNKDPNEISTAEIIAKKLKKPILKPKSKQTSNVKQTPPTIAKSRNKACKSTAKPSNMPVLQISAVCSGVSLEPTEPSASEFTPIFIKPEPQNRGYSDEQPTENPEETLPPTQPAEEPPNDTEDIVQTHTAEEQNYIASIDFNNIRIKQEKDIEISDVQITPKTIKTFANVNGIKRKRKQRRTHVVKDKTDDDDVNHDKLEDHDEEADHETDEEVEEENEDEEAEEEEEVEEEEEDEEVDDEEEDDDEELGDEEEEEREYRELEYPPELIDKNAEIDDNKQEPTTKDDHENHANQQEETKAITSQVNTTAEVATTNEKPSFVIASVCSQVALGISDNLQQPKQDLDEAKLSADNSEAAANNDNFLTSSTISDPVDGRINTNTDVGDINNPQTPALEISNANTITEQAIHDTHLNADPNSSHNTKAQEGATLQNLNTSMETNVTQTDIAFSLTPVLPSETLQANEQFNNLSLKLGQPFELKSESALNEGQNATIESSQITQNIHNHEFTQEQLCRDQDAQEELRENRGKECKQELSMQQNNLQNSIESNQECNGPHTADNAQIDQLHGLTAQQQILENSSHHALTETDLATQTSQDLQTVFKISSITSAAALDIKSEFNTNPISNNQEREELKDNQVEETATIEGVVEEAKELNLEAQPFTDTTQNTDGREIVGHENDDVNEDEEFDEEEGDEENSPQVNNLEERQNYQNQEVLTQLRPAALALHPYLEDISSSSNSLLSNSLSQTPPPAAAAASAQAGPALASTDQTQQRLLNTEETENILNETNDHLSRSRSSEVAVVAPPPLLAQQLPPHMPTFNFDNINEIAENNNNANIEREQLQDEQQLQHRQQQQQHQQSTTNTQ